MERAVLTLPLEERRGVRLLALAAAALIVAGGRAAAASMRVYVTNEGSGDVTVIDGHSRTVVDTWPVGKRPRGIAVSPDGRRLFVALSGSPTAGPGVDEKTLPPADKAADGIAVVDASDGRVERVLKVASDPEQIAISEAGTQLYVASEDTGKAIIVELRTGRVVARLDVGGEPEGVAVSAGRTPLACVSSEEDNVVGLLDVARPRVLERIAVGQRPRDCAFSADGRWLYVSAENDATLSVIDVRERKVVRTEKVPGEGARPKGIALSRDGRRLYLSTGRGGQVVAYDARRLEVAGTVAVGARPWGIALDPDDRFLFTANGPSTDVSVIDTRSLSVIATIKVGSRPWGVAVGPDR